MKSCGRTLRMGAESVIIHMSIILVLSFIFCMASGGDGLRGFVHADSGEDGSWSEKKYYHLDMGVQLAYQRSDAPGDIVYSSANPVRVFSTISFNDAYKRIKVDDVYPLESQKGRQCNLNSDNCSMNIAKNVSDRRAYYNSRFRDYVSLEMSDVTYSNAGLKVNFAYNFLAKSRIGLDVVKYGQNNQDDEIYDLFGGREALKADQPKVYDAVQDALEVGKRGDRDVNRLYLIFCPTVIEYRIQAAENSVEAAIDLPEQSFVCDEYRVRDISAVSRNSYIKEAVLYGRQVDSGDDFARLVNWHGSSVNLGENTGGVFVDKKSEPGLYEYKLYVENNFGKSSTDRRTIRIVEKSNVSVEARLGLPEMTYVGHEVIATDTSEYIKDGQRFNSFDAYRMNLGSGNFSVSTDDVEISNFETNRSKLRFNSPGVYTVTLTARTTSGLEDTDSKDIVVKDVPDVNLRIAGLQKQNRRQVVFADLIYDPRDEIKEYRLEMTDKKSGEKAILNADNPHHIGACIKTRDVRFAKLKNAVGFAEISLEFLTKKPDLSENWRDFECKVSLLLKSGRTAEKMIGFNVLPDSPPKAEIAVKERYIRNENSNTADIVVEDVSISDGDKLKRFWTYDGKDVFSLQGSRDYSFGAKKRISFQKEGVGKFDVGLRVLDDFIEDTLPEFIDEADFLSDEMTVVSEVDNIAPVVGLDLQKAVKSEISFIAAESLRNEITSKFGDMEIAFKDEQIDPKLHFVSAGRVNNDASRQLVSKKWESASHCQASRRFVANSKYWYNVSCENMYLNEHGELDCDGAHKIEAFNPENGSSLWSYHLPNTKKIDMHVDEQGRYLIVSHQDKDESMLIDAQSGDMLVKLNYKLPFVQHYTSKDGQRIYFPDSTGLYKLHIRYDGKHGFCMLNSDCIMRHERADGGILYFSDGKSAEGISLEKVKFSIEDEEFIRETMPVIAVHDTFAQENSFQIIGSRISDRAGPKHMLVDVTLRDSISERTLTACIIDESKLAGIIRKSNSYRSASIKFVTDASGRAIYVAALTPYREKGRYYQRLELYPLYGASMGSPKYICSINVSAYSMAEIIRSVIDSQSGDLEIATRAWGAFEERYTGHIIRLNKRELDSDILSPRIEKAYHSESNEYGGRYDLLWHMQEIRGYNRSISRYTRALNEKEAYINTSRRQFTYDMRNGIVRWISDKGSVTSILKDAQKSAIDESKFQKCIALSLKSNGGTNCSVSKNYILQPGKEYHLSFEYKATDEDSEIKLCPQISQKLGQITDIAGGRYYKAERTIPANCKWKNEGATSIIGKFEVPKGYFAIVKYDYSAYITRASEWRSGVYIDGIPDGQLPFSSHEEKAKYRNMREKGRASANILESGIHTFEIRKIGDAEIRASNIELILYREMSEEQLNAISPADNQMGDILNARFRQNQEVNAADGWKLGGGTIKTHEDYSLLKGYPARICRAADSRVVEKKYFASSEAEKGISYILKDISGEAVKLCAAMVTPYGYSGVLKSHDKSYRFSRHNMERDEDIKTLETVNPGDVTKDGIMDLRLESDNCYPEISHGNFLIYPRELERRRDLCVMGKLIYDKNSIPAGDLELKTQVFVPYARNENEDMLTINFENLKNSGEDGVLIRNLQLYYIDESGHKVYAEKVSGNSVDEIAGFELKNLKAESASRLREKPAAARVYKKNEKVIYGVKYSDYEHDPSGASFWSYEHTPYNDGEEELAEYIADAVGNVHSGRGKVLSKPIERFTKDGKYVVRHWQRDSTGNSVYDKLSKKSEIVFYVQGIAPGNAPWIKSIKPNPSPVKEDEYYALEVEVDDRDKDSLSVLIEVYYDGKLVQKIFKDNIAANDKGKYPIVETGLLKDAAKAGRYDVVATVRDKDGAGFDKLSFEVIRETGITGEVRHTDKWEQVRLKHNAKSPQKQRKENVFFSREKFVLFAKAAGRPQKVDVRIKEYPAYGAQLKKTGENSVYAGSIFSSALQKQLRKSGGSEAEGKKLTFMFTAYYSGGISKKHEVVVFIKDEIREGRLHRLY